MRAPFEGAAFAADFLANDFRLTHSASLITLKRQCQAKSFLLAVFERFCLVLLLHLNSNETGLGFRLNSRQFMAAKYMID